MAVVARTDLPRLLLSLRSVGALSRDLAGLPGPVAPESDGMPE